MRPSYVILIIFAVQVQKCEAGLFDWISNTWNSVKTSVVNWVNKAVADAKKWVKKALKDVNEKLGETFAPARKFAEDDWDCGADIMWFTNFFAKMIVKEQKCLRPCFDVPIMIDVFQCISSCDQCEDFSTSPTILLNACCKSVFSVNDACKMHDRCYSERKHSRVTCDLVFCEKLLALKDKLPKLSLCGVPETFCHNTLYGGFLAHSG